MLLYHFHSQPQSRLIVLPYSLSSLLRKIALIWVVWSFGHLFSVFQPTASFLVHLPLIFTSFYIPPTFPALFFIQNHPHPALWPLFLSSYISDKVVTIRSRSILHQSLRYFGRSICLVSSFIWTPHSPDLVQRFQIYGGFGDRVPIYLYLQPGKSMSRGWFDVGLILSHTRKDVGAAMHLRSIGL